ncbi:hypothetical protein HFO56_24220 [Rhizobium laguerreae]|uniref:hypothetical protein n=1 Tax=Rhizobium laguerreae TaxID=1076926 RepID=UPI001C8FC33E|nr:hypothetical protein [Rhizobium laguerreae]MBY3155436.1 hypothetical protein [Rhizobium laguerreae]
MKFKVKHPILVDAIPKGHRTRQLVAAMTESVFDIPELRLDIDATRAVSFETSKADRAKGAPDRTNLLAAEGGLFAPVWASEGIVNGIVQTTSGILISRRLASAAVEAVRREARAAASGDPAPKMVFTRDGGTPAAKEDKVSDKEFLKQPPLESLSNGTIDHEALRDGLAAIRAAVASEFVIVDKTFCRRVTEPFYAIVGKRSTGGDLKLCFGDVPAGMMAAFRLGRLDEARAFMDRLGEGGNQSSLSIVEGPGAHSELDDVALSVANAARMALMAFKSCYHHEYQSKQIVQSLMFETPLEHLTVARKLNDIVGSRNVFSLASEAERIAPILEEIVSFGEGSQFVMREWKEPIGFPMELVVDLWNNQSIDIDIAPRATTSGPR